jgi:hypothetical protein
MLSLPVEKIAARAAFAETMQETNDSVKFVAAVLPQKITQSDQGATFRRSN